MGPLPAPCHGRVSAARGARAEQVRTGVSPCGPQSPVQMWVGHHAFAVSALDLGGLLPDSSFLTSAFLPRKSACLRCLMLGCWPGPSHGTCRAGLLAAVWRSSAVWRSAAPQAQALLGLLGQSSTIPSWLAQSTEVPEQRSLAFRRGPCPARRDFVKTFPPCLWGSGLRACCEEG